MAKNFHRNAQQAAISPPPERDGRPVRNQGRTSTTTADPIHLYLHRVQRGDVMRVEPVCNRSALLCLARRR